MVLIAELIRCPIVITPSAIGFPAYFRLKSHALISIEERLYSEISFSNQFLKLCTYCCCNCPRYNTFLRYFSPFVVIVQLVYCFRTGNLTKFHTGRLRPKVKIRQPFYIAFIEKSTPFTKLLQEVLFIYLKRETVSLFVRRLPV